MAYDAISAAPPPSQGAASPAGQGAKAGAGGAQSSPFGALMAMFDATATPDAPAEASPAAPATDRLADEDVVALDAEQGSTSPGETADAPALSQTPVTLDDPRMAAFTPAAPIPAPSPTSEAQTLAPSPAAAALVIASPESVDLPPAPVELSGGPIALALADDSDASAPVAAPPVEPGQSKGDLRRAEVMNREPGAPGAAGAAASPESGNSNGRPSGEHPGGGQFNDPRTRGLNESRAAAPVETAAAAAAVPAPEAPAPSTVMNQPPALQAAMQVAQMAAALPVRGSPETVAHFAAQLIQKLDSQTTRFDLSLNPQSLGRVDVRIEIDRKGGLRAHMTFDTAEAVQQIGGRHAELRAALENAGFELAEGALSFDVASGGGRGGAFGDADANAGRMFQTLAETADPAPAILPAYFHHIAAGGVDIRV
jgi:flagellar hook-length control protein FliK